MASFYFKIDDGKIVGGPYQRGSLRHRTSSISASTTDPELRALGYLPQVKVGDDPIDSATQAKTGPVNVVGADRVTSTWTITNRTAQEIDDEKTDRAAGVVDSQAFEAVVSAIAAVQEEKGGYMVNADLAAVRRRAIAWLRGQV
jgi:hypothetical protein